MRTSTKVLLSRIVFGVICFVLVGLLAYLLWTFEPVPIGFGVLELFVLGMSLVVLIVGDRLIAFRIMRTLRRNLKLPHRLHHHRCDRHIQPGDSGGRSVSLARETISIIVFLLVFWLLIYGAIVLNADTAVGSHLARMWILPAAIGTMPISSNVQVPVYLRIPLMVLMLGLLLGQLYLSPGFMAGQIEGNVNHSLILAAMLAYVGFAGIAYIASRAVHPAFTLTGEKV